MANKSLSWDSETYGRIDIHEGPAKGSYTFSIRDPQIDSEGLLFLGIVRVGDKSMALKTKISDFPGLRKEITARRVAEAQRIAATPHTCDRCQKEFPREQATMRAATVGAFRTKLPYCPTCAKFLWETEDGFGDAGPGSTRPEIDATTYHKELDY